MALGIKFLALLIKTVSKPVANKLKESASTHPVFQSRLVALGQRMHELNIRMAQSLKSEAELAGRKVFLTRLDEQTALKKGADLLGETMIFSAVGFMLLVENRTSKWKDDAKEKKARASKAAVAEELRALRAGMESLQWRLDTEHRRLVDLEAASRKTKMTASRNDGRWWHLW